MIFKCIKRSVCGQYRIYPDNELAYLFLKLFTLTKAKTFSAIQIKAIEAIGAELNFTVEIEEQLT